MEYYYQTQYIFSFLLLFIQFYLFQTPKNHLIFHSLSTNIHFFYIISSYFLYYPNNKIFCIVVPKKKNSQFFFHTNTNQLHLTFVKIKPSINKEQGNEKFSNDKSNDKLTTKRFFNTKYLSRIVYYLILSLSLSLTHTHTHTHKNTLSPSNVKNQNLQRDVRRHLLFLNLHVLLVSRSTFLIHVVFYK